MQQTKDYSLTVIAETVDEYRKIPDKDLPHRRQPPIKGRMLHEIAQYEESFVNYYQANELLHHVIRLILTGHTPSKGDFTYLLSEIRRYDDPRNTLWRFCSEIAEEMYPQDPPPATSPCAEALARIMMEQWSHATDINTIENLLSLDRTWRKQGNTTMTPYSLALWLLKCLFPSQLQHFLHLLLQEGVSLTTEDLTAFSDLITEPLARKAIPYDFHALAWLTRRFGQALDGAYLEMATRTYKRECYAPDGNHFEPTPIEDLFNSLTHTQTAITIRKAYTIFPSDTDTADALASASNTPQPLLIKAIQYIASSSKDKSLYLGQPLLIPEHMSGEKLCRFLIQLSTLHIAKPVSMIKNLPSEDELRARTIELQLSGDGPPALLTDAIEARDKLESTATRGASANGILHNTLTRIVNSTNNISAFFLGILKAEMVPDDLLELMRLLFYVEMAHKRVHKHVTPYLCRRCITCAEMSATPSEKKAIRILKQLEGLHMLPQTHWIEHCDHDPEECPLSKQQKRKNTT